MRQLPDLHPRTGKNAARFPLNSFMDGHLIERRSGPAADLAELPPSVNGVSSATIIFMPSARTRELWRAGGVSSQRDSAGDQAASAQRG